MHFSSHRFSCLGISLEQVDNWLSSMFESSSPGYAHCANEALGKFTPMGKSGQLVSANRVFSALLYSLKIYSVIGVQLGLAKTNK